MTHDELLKRISIVGDTSIEEALRAVVELHKPYQGYVEEEKVCQVCRSNKWAVVYPCPTIQAIEKELV